MEHAKCSAARWSVSACQRRAICALLCLIVAMGCSSARSGHFAPVAAQHSRTLSHSRDVLTAQEIVTHPTLRNSTLHDALTHLRPEYMTPFLSNRGGTLAGLPVVIVDGNARSGLESLHSIQTSLVYEVRFLRPPDAVEQYGSSFRAGAVLVTTIPR